MTEEQRAEYIKQGGTHCPYCDGRDLDGKGIHVNAGTATQEILCTDCGNGWQDVYTLTHVEPD